MKIKQLRKLKKLGKWDLVFWITLAPQAQDFLSEMLMNGKSWKEARTKLDNLVYQWLLQGYQPYDILEKLRKRCSK